MTTKSYILLTISGKPLSLRSSYMSLISTILFSNFSMSHTWLARPFCFTRMAGSLTNVPLCKYMCYNVLVAVYCKKVINIHKYIDEVVMGYSLELIDKYIQPIDVWVTCIGLHIANNKGYISSNINTE